MNELPTIGIGLLGYAFMGKSHSNGIRQINYMLADPPARAELTALCGRDEAALQAAARQFGARHTYTDWREMLASAARSSSSITAAPTTSTPNPASPPPSRASISSARNRSPAAAAEALPMLEAARAAGVKHMTAYNYRFVPAVRQLRLLIDSGALGRIYHFRAVYLQDWLLPHMPARPTSGAWMPTAPAAVPSVTSPPTPWISPATSSARSAPSPPRPAPSPPNAPSPMAAPPPPSPSTTPSSALLEFENGALGTVEATRFALGRKNALRLEINGERGSVAFDLERLNEFQLPSRSTMTKPHQRLPHRPGYRAPPPLAIRLVAARPHPRLGAHLHPRNRPPAALHRRGRPRRPYRRRFRRWLPLRRHLRRHPTIRHHRAGE